MRLSICIVLFLVLFIPSARAAHLQGYWMMIAFWTSWNPNQPSRALRGPFGTQEACETFLRERLRNLAGIRIVESQCKFTDQVGF